MILMKYLSKNKVKRIIAKLAKETNNPESHYKELIWVEKRIRLNNIEIDETYLKEYDSYHNKYFEKLKERIKKEGLKKPLIVTYKNNLLADGLHRFKALKELGKKTAIAYHGFYPGNKIKWDLKKKKFVKER
ncbi:MAG: ParB N-terminal domain-containing protein [Nanoarchaeota archaeon]|nr:ParB N-terminal domain-containing protein [Nanoarchaeota archaeon]MBU1445409.1 ParB N-terminal domain-containing protein [Nanoarchaeota archaeon]MBU2420182.1 ParB N-terminal domain-containing protein [Nanoarchaeota archaeon]MBU2475368.1 ParB N-terminal domain-containing protein [Nanoarchaeota archaeon]